MHFSGDRRPLSAVAHRVVSLSLAALLLGLVGCGAAETPDTLPGMLEGAGVDLDALFAPATAAELDAIRADWADRDLSPQGVQVLLDRTIPGDRRLRVVAHDVGDVRHVGAIISPAESVSAPPRGIPVTLSLIGFGPPFELPVPLDAPPAEAAPSITVFPAFRGHTLIVEEERFVADGELYDQCDGGGDDALALVNVALSLEPRARADGFIVAGGSRGGNVSLLVGARDERALAVASIAGPTDYFERDYLVHPNLSQLYSEWFVRELLRGDLDFAEARRRMLSCSPAYFVVELPPTQLHHGTDDQAVPIESMDRLVDAWERTRSDADENLESYRYPGEGHAFGEALGLVRSRLDDFFGPILLAP